jgi:hypothetical protein
MRRSVSTRGQRIGGLSSSTIEVTSAIEDELIQKINAESRHAIVAGSTGKRAGRNASNRQRPQAYSWRPRAFASPNAWWSPNRGLATDSRSRLQGRSLKRT